MKWFKENNSAILQLLGVWIVYTAIFFLWKLQVEPVPAPEKYQAFYFPFINYLKSSIDFPENYMFLAELLMIDNAPLGLLLPAKIVSALGLQNFFLTEAYLYAMFLILPCGLIPFFFKLSGKLKWLLALLIFFFPPVQILLKTYSPEGICIIYHLLAYLLLHSYLATKNNNYLVSFFAAMWFSAATDTMGFIFLLILLKVCIVHCSPKPRELLKITSIFLLIILSVIPWYYTTSFNLILESINNDLLPITALSMLLYACLIFITLQKSTENSKRVRIPQIFNNFIFLGIFVLFYVSILVRDPETISSFTLGLFVILTGYGLLMVFSFRYNFNSLRGFTYLTCTIFSMKGVLLYEFIPGKASAYLTLPLIIILIRSYLETRQLSKQIGLLAVFFVCSNFCPPGPNLQKSLGDRGFRLVVNGTKSMHFNPLGWQNSQMYKILQQIESIFMPLENPKKESLCAFNNLHFHSRLLLNIPRSFQNSTPALKRLDDLPEKVLNNFSKKYDQLGEGLFETWLNHEKFIYLIEGLKPWETNHIPAAPLVVIQNSPKRKSELGMSLSRAFFEYLHKTGKINTYFLKHSIPHENPRINLYISRHLKKRKTMNQKMNLELSKLGLHLAIDLYNESPPEWFNKIHPEIQDQIRSREAMRIHGLGNEFLKQANFLQAHRYIRKAFQLDPHNLTIKTDYERIRSQLPDSFNKFLEN